MTFFDSNRIITARFWFESLLKPQIRNEIKDFKVFYSIVQCSWTGTHMLCSSERYLAVEGIKKKALILG